MATTRQNTSDNLIKRVQEEIIPLLEEASLCNAVSFSNPRFINCHESLDCSTTDCALYGNNVDSEPCWRAAEACCKGKPRGRCIPLYKGCYACKVFKDSCPTIVEELGEHAQNAALLLAQKHRDAEGYRQQIERIQAELDATLDQLRKKEREIQEVKITDKLTTLFNRQHLITVLEDEIARCQRYGRPIALMMIDIDEFRRFNDFYGRQAGDIMLSFMGTLIKQNTRKFDRAFRYGGEEFVVVLPESDLTMAYIVAERIRKGFESRSFSVTRQDNGKSETASHTVSVGLTATFAFGTQDVSIDYLISQTEEALLQAKEKAVTSASDTIKTFSQL